MSDLTIVPNSNQSLKGLVGLDPNLPSGLSDLRFHKGKVSPSLKTIAEAVSKGKKQIADAKTVGILDANQAAFDETFRKITAFETVVFKDQLENPSPYFGQTIRSTSRATIKPMTAEQLAAVDFGAQAKTTSEITAEEAARLVSSEVKAIEAKKVIEQQTLDAEQAQQIADLQAQQIRDLQAAEVARRANEVDAPKLTETLGGKFAVGLAKAAVEVGLATAAPVIGPIVRGLVL